MEGSGTTTRQGTKVLEDQEACGKGRTVQEEIVPHNRMWSLINGVTLDINDWEKVGARVRAN